MGEVVDGALHQFSLLGERVLALACFTSNQLADVGVQNDKSTFGGGALAHLYPTPVAEQIHFGTVIGGGVGFADHPRLVRYTVEFTEIITRSQSVTHRTPELFKMAVVTQ